MAYTQISGPVVGIGAGSKTEAAVNLLQAIDAASATQVYPLGTTVKATDPTTGYEGTFLYSIGVASLAAGDAVCFAGAGSLAPTRALAATVGKFGVAMAAIGATSYGWFAIAGTVPVNVATGNAINPAYTTATAGVLDDAVVSGSEVPGALFLSAIGTPAAGQSYIQFPETCVL